MRSRQAHHDEPKEGSIVVWRFLGFGGKPNPLVFARISSVLIRTGQALFPRGHAKSLDELVLLSLLSLTYSYTSTTRSQPGSATCKPLPKATISCCCGGLCWVRRLRGARSCFRPHHQRVHIRG